MKDLPPQYKNIIQFSPIRSGSTLVYNILKRCLPQTPITKGHNFLYNPKNFYVTTIRHPFDCIISNCLRKNREISCSTLSVSAEEYLLWGGGDTLSPNLNKKNVLILYYKEFAADLDYVFDALEQSLGVVIPKRLRVTLEQDLSIKSVQNLTKNYKSFEDYDPGTHWHGNHISKYEGKTDFNKILSKEQLLTLQSHPRLRAIINRFFTP